MGAYFDVILVQIAHFLVNFGPLWGAGGGSGGAEGNVVGGSIGVTSLLRPPQP